MSGDKIAVEVENHCSLVNPSQIFKKVTWKEIMTDQPTNQPTGQLHF